MSTPARAPAPRGTLPGRDSLRPLAVPDHEIVSGR